MMLEPHEVQIKAQSGEEKTYIISKFPAVAGREIVTQYPISALPKVGDYKTNESLMLKVLSYVAVDTDGRQLQLTTRALIDNHVPDWESLVKLEAAMMEYNCSFFQNGKASTFFEGIAAKAQALISSTLMASSAQSSEADKQP
jgi:hypothetical protein